jgi:hypothetical protein
MAATEEKPFDFHRDFLSRPEIKNFHALSLMKDYSEERAGQTSQYSPPRPINISLDDSLDSDIKERSPQRAAALITPTTDLSEDVRASPHFSGASDLVFTRIGAYHIPKTYSSLGGFLQRLER